jgi:DNA-binding HxlR family transcriptional regulator
MQRKSLKAEPCPIARTLDLVGEWWTPLILRDAFNGIKRFSEFQQSLGLAKNVLSARLRKLVKNGIMELIPASDGSAYSEYVLTDKGRSLFTVLVALRQWGEANLFEPGEMKLQLVDRLRRQPIRTLEVRSMTGRLLGPGDMMLAAVDDGGKPLEPGMKRTKEKND